MKPLQAPRKSRLIRPLALLLALLFCVAVQAQSEIRVAGNGSGTAVLERLATLYRSHDPKVVVRAIKPPMGSKGSLRALDAGTIDLAVISVAAGEDVTKAYPRTDPLLPWLRSPMVFTGRDVVAGTGLTLEEVVDIYAGRTTKWADGRQIRLIVRHRSDVDTRILQSSAKALKQALEQAMVRIGAAYAENDLQNQHLLESTPGSLGAVPLGQLMLTGAVLQPMILDGIEPSVDNLRTGRYRIEKQLYLALPHKMGPQVRAFVQFLQSPATLRMLEQHGFLAFGR